MRGDRNGGGGVVFQMGVVQYHFMGRAKNHKALNHRLSDDIRGNRS